MFSIYIGNISLILKKKIYSLNGDSNELGSIQNPTNAWKNSINSWSCVCLTIRLKYDFENEDACLNILDKIEWHCVRKNSAGGPRIPFFKKITSKIIKYFILFC